MKVFVLGDVHGQTWFFRSAVENAIARGCEALVQVGDFGLWWPGYLGARFMASVREITNEAAAQGLTCYVIPGNHENYDLIDSHVAGLTGKVDYRYAVPIYDNLIYLPKGAAFKLGETTCLAAGGAVSVDKAWRSYDFDPAKRSWWPQEGFTEKDALAAQVAILDHKPSVLFTHAVPGVYAIPGLSHLSKTPWAGMVEEVEMEQLIIQEMIVKFAATAGSPFHTIVHGHTHIYYDMAYPPDESIRVIGLAHDGASMKRKENWVILDL